jgi:uncharacterized protein (DUF302 family)
MNFDVSYGFSQRLPGSTIAAVKERVIEALKAEGFGVLTEIDVQATLKKKLDVDREPYVILGACNPGLANQAIEREPAIGLLLPCNVVVAQDGADVVVSFASPRAMFRIVERAEGLTAIAEEAETRLRRVLEKVAA